MSRKADTNGSLRKRTASVRVPMTIRLPEDVVKRIDEELGQRDIPQSRNNWLLEAVIEKLRKGSSGGSHGAK